MLHHFSLQLLLVLIVILGNLNFCVGSVGSSQWHKSPPDKWPWWWRSAYDWSDIAPPALPDPMEVVRNPVYECFGNTNPFNGLSSRDISCIRMAFLGVEEIGMTNASLKDAGYSESLLGRGWLFLRSGDALSALQMFQAAVEHGHVNLEKKAELCVFAHFQGNFEAALYECSMSFLFGTFEQQKMAAFALATLTFQTNMMHHRMFSQQMASLYDAAFDSHNLLELAGRAIGFYGMFMYSSTRYEEAAKSLQLALTLAPENVLLMTMMGDALGMTKDNHTAKKWYLEAIAKEERNYDAYFGAATMEIAGGEKQVASGHYKRGLEMAVKYGQRAIMSTEGIMTKAVSSRIFHANLPADGVWQVYTTGAWLQHGKRKYPVKASNIAIVTLYDENGAALAKVWNKSWTKYAEKHGYPIIRHEGTLDPTKPAAWSKLRLMMRELQRYEWVVWSDIDTVILNDQIKLEDYIAAVPEGTYLIGQGDYHAVFNSGVFFMKKSQWSQDYLQEIDQLPNDPSNGFWENIAMLRLWMQKNEDSFDYRQRMFLMPYGALHIYPHHATPAAFIVHFPGNHHKDFYMNRLLGYIHSQPEPWAPPYKKAQSTTE